MSRNRSRSKRSLPVASEVVSSDDQTTNTSLTRFEAAFFQGPLPPPETLARYEEICPGAADRILSMAEAQSRHRQGLEERVIASNCRAQDRGPLLGFVLALGVIGLGAYLILKGREISGLVALVTALIAIVVPFVYGKREQKKELQKKNQDLAATWDYSDNSTRAARQSR